MIVHGLRKKWGHLLIAMDTLHVRVLKSVTNSEIWLTAKAFSRFLTNTPDNSHCMLHTGGDHLDWFSYVMSDILSRYEGSPDKTPSRPQGWTREIHGFINGGRLDIGGEELTARAMEYLKEEDYVKSMGANWRGYWSRRVHPMNRRPRGLADPARGVTSPAIPSSKDTIEKMAELGDAFGISGEMYMKAKQLWESQWVPRVKGGPINETFIAVITADELESLIDQVNKQTTGAPAHIKWIAGSPRAAGGGN